MLTRGSGAKSRGEHCIVQRFVPACYELIPDLRAFAVLPLHNGNRIENVKQFTLSVLDHYTDRNTLKERYSFYKYKILKDLSGSSLHERRLEYNTFKSGD